MLVFNGTINKKNSNMVSMLEPSFRFSFAKIAFYAMRVKHKAAL